MLARTGSTTLDRAKMETLNSKEKIYLGGHE